MCWPGLQNNEPIPKTSAMDSNQLLTEIIKQRILVLDGAMGTMIQRHGLQEEDFRGARFSRHPLPLKGCNEVLSLTRHELIQEIHREYLHAGADLIETNTFNATRISLQDYGLAEYAYEINAASARWARIVADEFTRLYPAQPRFVVGSIGPTGKTLSISPDVNDPSFRSVTFREMTEVYEEQVKGLMDGGVHALLVETIFDTLNARAALFAIAKIFEETGRSLPVMLSVTLSDASGRTLSGQTLEAFLVSVSHFPLFSVGLNCALGAAEMTPYLKRIRRHLPCYISAYPNAGLPNALGGYDEKPEQMAAVMREWLEGGLVNIIGGCCGTTPDHIRLLSAAAADLLPPAIPEIPPHSLLSGLEPLQVGNGTNFIQIGERTNVSGSRKFARLIAEKKYEEALTIARHQVEAGALVLDVNMDDGLLDAEAEMRHFLLMLSTEPDIARVPVMIDSSRWEVIEAGLQCLQGKSIVNSISLKEGPAVFLERARLIRRYGAAVVVMAFDEEGQATSYFRKISICKRAYELLVKEAGFPPEDIYFDPNVLTIATGVEEHNAFAADFIEAVRWIRQNLPGARISGGISNLSYAFRGNNSLRAALHSVFLYHAIRAGLDMGIVNAAELPIYDEIPADLRQLCEEVILNTRPGAAESLIRYVAAFQDQETRQETEESLRSADPVDRIRWALMKGIPDHLPEDLEILRKQVPGSLAIIEGPLMDAMNAVGELFGQGKMFLPQVVKSARVMKKAVEYLMPYVQAEKEAGGAAQRKAVIIMATVKGDVHDIGKNIAGLVLSCNNFEVIDLGVMVPANVIVEAAIKHQADAIGLSGLITPSLEEMVSVAEEMERAGLRIPLIIGGATTSEKHTALKIAPVYSGPVVHVHDAGKAVGVINQQLSANRTESGKQQQQQEQLRTQVLESRAKKQRVSFAEACQHPASVNWSSYHFPIPHFEGIKTLKATNLQTLIPFIDWSFFFYAWDIPGKYPEVLDHPEKGPEARTLFSEAQSLLNDPAITALFDPAAVFGIFPANAHGEEIRIYTNDFREEVRETLYFLRSQEVQEDRQDHPCLADFVAPEGYPDHIGLFTVTAGKAIVAKAREWAEAGEEYRSFLLLTLADRIAEAFAELLHYKVRTEFWGYSQEAAPVPEDLFHNRFPGIRPAPGYPSCPDLSESGTIFRLLGVSETLGVRLTETFAMDPVASVCGYYFSHPESRYFAVGPVGQDQLENYAERKKLTDLNTLNYLK